MTLEDLVEKMQEFYDEDSINEIFRKISEMYNNSAFGYLDGSDFDVGIFNGKVDYSNIEVIPITLIGTLDEYKEEENLIKKLEDVVNISEDISKLNKNVHISKNIAKEFFRVSPEVLKYGHGILKNIARLGKEIAESGGFAAMDFFNDCPEVLKNYKENDLMDYLDDVFELSKEIAKTNGRAAYELFENSPEILKYGYDVLEDVTKLGEEIAKYSNFAVRGFFKGSSGVLEHGYDVLEDVAELGKEIAEVDRRAARWLFGISPDVLKYGYDVLEDVVGLYKEVAEVDKRVARWLFENSPEVLKSYKENDLLDYLDGVFELSKEVAKVDGWAARWLFEYSPKVLKYGYDVWEDVADLSKEIAKKDVELARDLFKNFDRYKNVLNSNAGFDEKIKFMQIYNSVGSLYGVPELKISDEWMDSVKEKLVEKLENNYNIKEFNLDIYDLIKIDKINLRKDSETISELTEKYLKFGVEKNFESGKIYNELIVSGSVKSENPVEMTEHLIYGLIGSRNPKNIEKASEIFEEQSEKLESAQIYVKGREKDIFHGIKDDFSVINGREEGDKRESAKNIINYLRDEICSKSKSGKAEPLSDILNVIEGEFQGRAVCEYYVVKMQEGTIDDLFDSATTRCCAFQPEGMNRSAASRYLVDKNIGLLQIVPKHKNEYKNSVGVAILANTEDKKGEKYLLVDSVEGGGDLDSGVLENVWKDEFYNAITQVAKENGCSKIIYNEKVTNPRPKRFLGYLEEKKVKKDSVYLEKIGGIEDIKEFDDEHYLEAFGNWNSPKGKVSGYVVEVN